MTGKRRPLSFSLKKKSLQLEICSPNSSFTIKECDCIFGENKSGISAYSLLLSSQVPINTGCCGRRILVPLLPYPSVGAATMPLACTQQLCPLALAFLVERLPRPKAVTMMQQAKGWFHISGWKDHISCSEAFFYKVNTYSNVHHSGLYPPPFKLTNIK